MTTPWARKKIAELRKRIEDSRRLSKDEYLEHLHQVRKNALLRLEIKTLEDETLDTGAWLNIADKVHWLIDSVEPKQEVVEKPQTIILKFEPDDDPD